MKAVSVQLASAYVLHQRPYRETSALLEVFAEEYGRVGLVARGVRSAKSKQRGELQALRPLRLSWLSRGELGTLTGVESDGRSERLQGAALYSAFYLNELLMRLLARQDPHPTLYRLYRDSLQRLAQETDVEPVLRVFEKRLLEELGYGLLLDHEVQTGAALDAAAYYDYQLESGPVPVVDAQAAGFVFRGSSLLALADERLDTPQVRQDAKRLIRSALNLYLGNKPLKSRELFRVPKK